MRSNIRIRLAHVLLAITAIWPLQAGATVILSPDGMSVYDTVAGVTWLANMDLAASNTFGLPNCQSNGNVQPCVNTSGSMTYAAAEAWIANMNSTDYLGHNNWQLPVTQSLTAGCTATGPHGENFAYNCSGSALGFLYSGELNLLAPNPVADPSQGSIGQFTNLQPNIYWSGTAGAGSGNGVHTFSFATGWRGLNQGTDSSGPKTNPGNYFYVLPMLPVEVAIPGTVIDPAAKVTWLADGNIAAENRFGLPLCSGLGTGTEAPCVNANGTMTTASAQAFIDAMNNSVNPDKSKGWLGRRDWQLPPSTEAQNCQYSECVADPTADPMASLYYKLLRLSAGSSVAGFSTGANGPFSNLQPNLYWSCPAADNQGSVFVSACSPVPQCTPSTQPNPCANNMEWSFNYLDGFQGTDGEANDLFVTAYYTRVPEPGSLADLGAGLAVVSALRRRRRADRPAGKAGDHISCGCIC